MTEKKIEIELEYAKNILKVLEDFNSMGFEMVSLEIKEMISPEAYDKIYNIFCKYHNANCGPFNRHLKNLINKQKCVKRNNLDIVPQK